MNKTLKVICALIFVVLLNAGLFTFANIKLTTFWMSWAFMHIAFAILVYVFVFSVPEQKKIIFSYSESAVTVYYFIIAVAAGLVLMFQFAFFPVIAFAIQFIIVAGFLIAFFSVKKMNHSIDREEIARAEDLRHFNLIVESMKEVVDLTNYSAPYKKMVEHTYDAIAGSQVRSVQQVYEIEKRILDLIGQLKQNVINNDEESIKTCCSNIETEVAERNRQIRLSR